MHSRGTTSVPRWASWRSISTNDSASTNALEALSFCVVGSGPAGFYTAEKLMKKFGSRATVDLLDRLPTPFGLVRSGVAPDHQDTKNVIRQFTASAQDARLTFYGNVEVGRDVSVAELRQRYHAVVLAYGAESDRRLGIPGEDAQGVMSAREFVWWYNAHPDAAQLKVDLSKVHSVAICGVGNVALDCSRVLLKGPAQLAPTDLAAHALQHLSSHSAVREVHLVARRGPAQAAFTPKELKELLTQSDIQTCAGPRQMDTSPADKADMAAVRMKRRLLDIMSSAVTDSESKAAAANAAAPTPPPAISHISPSSAHASQQHPAGAGALGTRLEAAGAAASASPPQKKKIHLQFYRSPVEVVSQPSAADPKVRQVTGLRVEKTALVGSPAVAQGTGEFEVIPAQMVLVSIGYRSLPLPGVPFDARRGVVPNLAGRVTSEGGIDGVPGVDSYQGLYVVGWLKRGPSGIIGTNLLDAEETVACIVHDEPTLAEALLQRMDAAQGSGSALGTMHAVGGGGSSGDEGSSSSSGRVVGSGSGASLPQSGCGGDGSPVSSLSDLLSERDVKFVGFSDWSRLDEYEVHTGKQLGKVRHKVADQKRMMEICLGSSTSS
ncbi:MAG: hypothetical protein WDW36_006641 [Sanguina aurantia]